MPRIFKRYVSFIDLFAGIGGFRIALEKIGAKCIFSSEIDKYARYTYQQNFEEEPMGDITEIHNKDIPGHYILCAGFPCQPFSISGNQYGFEDTRGTMFYEIARIVEHRKPMILFLENVGNLKMHDNQRTFKTMGHILKNLGYDIFYEVINAGDHGLPQSRKRFYIIGFRKDLGVDEFAFPEPRDNFSVLQDDGFLLPDELTNQYVINREDINLYDIEVTQRQPKPIKVGIINYGGQGDRIYSPLGHAITLTAHGGGAGSKTGAYLINNRIRKLHPRECANIQGFPQDFIIPVSDAQAWKQFGNSVAIPVLEALLEKILNLEQLRPYTMELNEDFNENEIINF